MSMGYAARATASFSLAVLSNQEAEDCLIPMGLTSENINAAIDISRFSQDIFAAHSFHKAIATLKSGVVPI